MPKLTFGRIKLSELIGRGAYGRVYSGMDINTGKSYAVKLIGI